MAMPRQVTRFAPSPTGYLHIGHAHSALDGWRRARLSGGRFLLRIEDIDRARCRPEFEGALLADLRWLGVDWDGDVRRQSEHFPEYAAALEQLSGIGVLYPCFCTRGDIARAGSAPHGPDGPLYPGTCHRLSQGEIDDRLGRGASCALRLDARQAHAICGPLAFEDERAGRIQVRPELYGDIVLARRDTPCSYHLCVTLDDDVQGITLVTRGEDLLPATHVHRLLQALLGLREPSYAHHPILNDKTGERLAKRAGAATLRSLREQGRSAAEVRALAGF